MNEHKVFGLLSTCEMCIKSICTSISMQRSGAIGSNEHWIV